jgi:hypothetical protein
MIKHWRKESTQQPGIRQQVNGMTIPIMKKWISSILRPFSQPEKQIILLDLLRVHTNRSVIKQMEDLNFEVRFFPAQGAKNLSPLDNTLFSAFKTKLRSLKASSFDEKLESCETVWKSITRHEVKNYFRHCGLKTIISFIDDQDETNTENECEFNILIISHFTCDVYVDTEIETSEEMCESESGERIKQNNRTAQFQKEQSISEQSSDDSISISFEDESVECKILYRRSTMKS